MSHLDPQEWQHGLRNRAGDDLEAVRGFAVAVLICAPFWGVAFLVWRSCL